MMHETAAMTTRTRMAVVAPGMVVALALVVAAVALAPSLPGRVAIHFAADGQPDGWGSPWVLLGIALGLAVLGVVVAVVSLGARDRRTAATGVLVVHLLAGSLAAAWIAIAASAAVGDGTLPMWWAAVILSVGAVAAAIPALALIRGAAPVPAHDVPPLAVPATARVAWRAHAGSGWFAGVGALVLALGISVAVAAPATGVGSAALAAVPLLVAGLSMLALARVEVTVDARGLRVTSSWSRIPVMRVPLDRIESGGWEDVSPGQWGGWGLRLSGRGVAYVTRSGPGLVVRLRNGRARLVTVADAERGAAVVATLVAARGAA
jgi:hypothetical protein